MFSLSNLFPSGDLTQFRETMVTALRSLQAQVQTTWFKQHASDGTHGDVTATLLSAPRHRHSGLYVARLAYVAASSYRTAGAFQQPIFNEVVVPRDVGVVLFEPDDSASADSAVGGGGYDVGSLVLPRTPQTGDVILVGRSDRSTYPVNLRNVYVSGRQNHKFFIQGTVANPDSPFVAFTFAGPGLLMLTYLEAPYALNTATESFSGWMSLMTVSDRATPL